MPSSPHASSSRTPSPSLTRLPQLPLRLLSLIALAILLSSPSTLASDQPAAPRNRFLVRRGPSALERRHALAVNVDPHHPALQHRQFTGLFPPAGGATTTDATTTAATTTAAATTTSRNVLDSIINDITSSTAQTTSAATSATDRSTSSSARSSRSSSLAVVTSTSTSGSASLSGTLPPLSSASGSADQKKDDDGGGIGKGTLIAVIVIASCVGGVAAIWTVIRKWKFSPSKRFEDKLQPIDFGDGIHNNNKEMDNSSQTGLVRANSNAKSEVSNHSWNRGQGGGLNRSDTNAGGWGYGMHQPAHNPYAAHQGFGQEYYPPPPSAPFGQQGLARGDSWRSAPGGGMQPQMGGGYGGYNNGRYI